MSIEERLELRFDLREYLLEIIPCRFLQHCEALGGHEVPLELLNQDLVVQSEPIGSEVPS